MKHLLFVILAAALTAAGLGAVTWQPQYQIVAHVPVLHPWSGVKEGLDGRFYGTASDGFSEGVSKIFVVDPSGNLETLHEFSPSDGRAVYTELTLGPGGVFYGLAQAGGATDNGTIFKFDPVTATFTKLHDFADVGAAALGALTVGTDGNLYGTTRGGGSASRGTIFRVTPSGTFTTLYSFSGPDGLAPTGALLETVAGTFYGTTALGGRGRGTIFKFDTAGSLTTVHAFSGPDGEWPSAGVIKGANGNLFGTTYLGGSHGVGTVYELNTSGTLTTLHSFSTLDGAYLEGGIVEGSDGRFYGGTCHGGSRKSGTLFAIDTLGNLTTLHHFNGVDGKCPRFNPVIQARSGHFLGSAFYGNVIFRLSLRDLVQSHVSNPPEISTPGTSFLVTDTTENSGIVEIAESTNRYYLSRDRVKSSSDYRLIGGRMVGDLQVDGASSGSVMIKVPTVVPVGTYWLAACADDLRQVTETNENNNCWFSSTSMRVDWPDLVTFAVIDPPLTVLVGGSFTIGDTVRNQGLAPAAESRSRYYLSIDGLRDAGDILMAGTRLVPGLAADAESAGSRRLTVPQSATPGEYFVLACADDTNKVPEPNNANNCRASSTTLTVQ